MSVPKCDKCGHDKFYEKRVDTSRGKVASYKVVMACTNCGASVRARTP